MTQLSLKALIAKLNTTTKVLLEKSAGFCLNRTHFYVEIEHLLYQLAETKDTDFVVILKQYEIDQSALIADLQMALSRLKTGNSKAPALSPDVIEWVRSAFLFASLDRGEQLVRTSHLLVAMLSDDTLFRSLRGITRQFDRLSADQVRDDYAAIIRASKEMDGVSANTAGAANNGETAAINAEQPALAQFTIDLTEQATAGKLDPVLGRDDEIRQMIDILTRRRQNNPILTGEAGVGKTAVVEGLALKIAAGEVPEKLKNISLKILDLTLLQAGASMKGVFEERLQQVINEVKSSPKPIVLFIDEAHNMVGAGGQAGQGDAANLLKPALARGELRTIAATTWAEYKKYFEKDAALTRRFQVVKVDEPNINDAIQMMRGVAPKLQQHHGVLILDEAIVASVKLSARYITGRQLPDKCVSLLDTACAKVAMSQHAKPQQIEATAYRLVQIEREVKQLAQEQQFNHDHQARIDGLNEEKITVEAQLKALDEQFEQEKTAVANIHQLQKQLIAEKTAGSNQDLKAQLQKAEQQLLDAQQNNALIFANVGEDAIAEVVASWTGIPVGKMVRDDFVNVLQLKQQLAERVVGQDIALKSIAEQIQIARANLQDPKKPLGVFLLVGTSGVGKTETACALAELLYGGEKNMTVINMSEFKEEHKVSLLTGSPPGYVGYGEGGVLTEAVRRNPYSVILLDEMEKAHPGVQEIFYQVFDKGMIMDGEGREIDFKNTLILMTSNAASDVINQTYQTAIDDAYAKAEAEQKSTQEKSGEANVSIDSQPDEEPELNVVVKLPEEITNADALMGLLRPHLSRVFKPAFLGRVKLLPYLPLTPDVLFDITGLKLAKVVERMKQHYDASLTFDVSVLESIVDRCSEVETGARNIDHIIEGRLLPELATACLARLADEEVITTVMIQLDEQGDFCYQFD